MSAAILKGMWQSNSRRGSSKSHLHGVELRATRNFHLKRVECRISGLESESGEAQISGRFLLNDLTTQGLAIYAPGMLPLGSLITIEFDYPEKVVLKAKVGWCQQLIGSRKIITESSPTFRIGLLFEHEKPEDQERLKSFCERLADIYPGVDLTRAPYVA